MQDQNDEITDLLVAYALDALEPEELARVDRLLAERPELRRELAELQATAALLPHSLPEAQPPPELRQQTLDRALGRSAPTPGPARRLRGWLYALGGLAGASLVALVIALSGLASARVELADLRQQLAQAQQQLAQAERQVADLGAERDQLAQAVAGATSIAELQGERGRAAVLQSSQGEILVAAQLPPLDPGQIYQLWIIAGEGATPASAGTFSVDQSGYGLIALGPGATAPGITLAVTAEPAPGSATPTLPILLAGQIS